MKEIPRGYKKILKEVYDSGATLCNANGKKCAKCPILEPCGYSTKAMYEAVKQYFEEQ